jgi:alcohol dehydrogenase class IV
MRFEFATAGRIIFGSGTRAEAGMIASEYGQVCMLVHGRHEEPGRQVRKILESAGIQVHLFAVQGEPELNVIRDLCTQVHQNDCDLIVAVGGGSVLDAGKAAAGLAQHTGDVLDYLEVIGSGKKLVETPLPFIAMPTTAGTGSEVTKNAVISSPEHRVKASLRSALILPKVALVDPELTVSMPPDITAATGMDAFTQLVEPFVCKKVNPLVDSICREGLRHFGRNLITVFQDGNDLAAREEMALAAMFSGLALANSGLGAVHGLAGPLGGLLNAPHGALCARLVGPVCEVNIRKMQAVDADNPSLKRYAEISGILNQDETPEVFGIVELITRAVEEMGIPKLRDYGIDKTMYPDVIAQSKKSSSMQANPINLEDEDLQRILELAN